MKGHVARKRDRYYSVIYEGLDPVTGKERRTWHPAGTDRTEAAALVARLAAERRRVAQRALAIEQLGRRLQLADQAGEDRGVRRRTRRDGGHGLIDELGLVTIEDPHPELERNGRQRHAGRS